jgi:hypothetical protein
MGNLNGSKATSLQVGESAWAQRMRKETKRGIPLSPASKIAAWLAR